MLTREKICSKTDFYIDKTFVAMKDNRNHNVNKTVFASLLQV